MTDCCRGRPPRKSGGALNADERGGGDRSNDSKITSAAIICAWIVLYVAGPGPNGQVSSVELELGTRSSPTG